MAGLLTRRWPRSFADRVTGSLPGPPQFLRLWREGGFAGATSGVSRIPVALRSPLPASGSWLTWLGHASLLLRLGGLTVAVDPVLSARILGAGRRFTPPGVDRLPLLDLLLISHNHYDHLDAPTLRPLARDTPVVAPNGNWPAILSPDEVGCRLAAVQLVTTDIASVIAVADRFGVTR